MSYPLRSLLATRPVRTSTAAGLALLIAGCASGPQFETLSARVVSESPAPLAPDATLEVQLENASTGDVLASSRVEHLGAFPLPVTLRYAPQSIRSDDLYQLDAQIRRDGRIVYLSPEPLAVFGADAPETLDIRVEPTGTGAIEHSSTDDT
ncbi:YbaY family lipoprotein [Salinicola aestuarinus]|uniref:YbaY family lipoprotein n=1 Tax=Salinicola aestuarinus TaxID=1949082 RepID=UPI001300ABAD|nr:YbaY family lipoprotein [Salinicola aestuarinus]